MQPEHGMPIGWFSCPTRDCNNEWDKHWIADIYFMDKVHFENPHYSAFLNGTLLIKKVLPMYDERYFIMRVRTGTGDEPNIYHLKVVQGNVYLLVILFYMLSPCVLLATWLLYQYFSFFLKPVSRAPSFDTGQSTKYICLWRDGRFSWSSGEGLPPYPRVSLSRVLESNESVIQEASNVSSQILMKIPSITNADSGDYVLYTENTVGNDTVTVRVNVEGKFILLTCTYWCWIPGVGVTFHISTEMPLIVMRKGALVTRCHQKILIS